MAGFVIGMLRLVSESTKDNLGGILFYFADVNFLYIMVILFLFCFAVMIVISLLTSALFSHKINGLSYGSTVSADKAKTSESWGFFDLVLSIIIIVFIAFILMYFSQLVFSLTNNKF
jgi:SSS family solute:Na+ symporter